MMHDSSCGCPDCENFHPDRFSKRGEPAAASPAYTNMQVGRERNSSDPQWASSGSGKEAATISRQARKTSEPSLQADVSTSNTKAAVEQAGSNLAEAGGKDGMDEYGDMKHPREWELAEIAGGGDVGAMGAENAQSETADKKESGANIAAESSASGLLAPPLRNEPSATLGGKDGMRKEQDWHVETGWVLIKNDKGRIWYIGVIDYLLGWTNDNLKALRLARREDADKLAEICEDADKVEEHQWCGPVGQSALSHSGTTPTDDSLNAFWYQRFSEKISEKDSEVESLSRQLRERDAEIARWKALDEHLPAGFAIGDDATAALAIELAEKCEQLRAAKDAQRKTVNDWLWAEISHIKVKMDRWYKSDGTVVRFEEYMQPLVDKLLAALNSGGDRTEEKK